MRSGVRKRVLIPAVLISVVCTLILGAYCMFLQVRLAVQIQEEDIRECMEAVPKVVEKVSREYKAAFPYLADKYSVHLCRSADGVAFSSRRSSYTPPTTFPRQ